MSSPSLVVIGGGAAGFFCAVNAARMNPALQVVILEKNSKLLSKVRISGGGRCNITHQEEDIRIMSGRYPRGHHFVRKAFHRFFTTDTVQWFEQRGVKLKTEKDGRMFPVTDNSETVINCLLQEAGRYGVRIMMQAEVIKIIPESKGFSIRLKEKELRADYLCVATGGYPKKNMFSWLEETGHGIEEPVPSLFTFNMPGNSLTSMPGLSVEHARVTVEGTKLVTEGPVLVTHWGLSGPAILKLSAWGARELAAKEYHFNVQVNWVYALAAHEQALRDIIQENRAANPSRKVSNLFQGVLPARLWQFLAGAAAEMRFADLPKKTENALIRILTGFTAEVKGKTTFKEEFVTAGGIRLPEVEPSTLMSRKWPGLFFAGEVLDVDGITGGYNFQHAWTSGFTAAAEIARLSSV